MNDYPYEQLNNLREEFDRQLETLNGRADDPLADTDELLETANAMVELLQEMKKLEQ